MSLVKTNNVTRMLDAKKIAYQAFELLAEKLSALEIAALLDLPAEQIYKTIVFKRSGPGKPVLALVPAPCEVDAKKLASALGEKKMLLTTQNEAESLTGLLSGGISPLALLNKGFQVVMDVSAETRENVLISAGQRGLQVRIGVKDLFQLTHARFADIAEKPVP